MDRRAFLRTAVPTAAVGLAGCIGGGTPSDYDVGMGAKVFRPETIEVSAGTTVTWLNTNKQGHSVTAYESGLPDGADYFASGGFDSEEAARDAWGNSSGGTMFEGDTFEHTFEVPGEYPYFCIPHETGGMVGTVVVTGESATPTEAVTATTD
ncbi:plastocyanin/azurin family copper-binding protein [Haloarcula laminariae]|uniref:plastocyanin/azurin family copper-binding protein n=1 Tax=Haloarcula laminariae TaxID=2961577 RepID=UPI0021C9386D|nr:plastocyanin/azurin family copper-binding protein [Halomicroarcula laminariae]